MHILKQESLKFIFNIVNYTVHVCHLCFNGGILYSCVHMLFLDTYFVVLMI